MAVVVDPTREAVGNARASRARRAITALQGRGDGTSRSVPLAARFVPPECDPRDAPCHEVKSDSRAGHTAPARWRTGGKQRANPVNGRRGVDRHEAAGAGGGTASPSAQALRNQWQRAEAARAYDAAWRGQPRPRGRSATSQLPSCPCSPSTRVTIDRYLVRAHQASHLFVRTLRRHESPEHLELCQSVLAVPFK